MSSLHVNSSTIETVSPTALTCMIRWSATRSRWAQGSASADGIAHEQTTFVLSVRVRESRASIEAWMETDAGPQRVVQQRRIAPCGVRDDDGFVHVDVEDGDESLLKLTATPAGDVVYARSSLLGREASAAGLFDPPVGVMTRT